MLNSDYKDAVLGSWVACLGWDGSVMLVLVVMYVRGRLSASMCINSRRVDQLG